MRRAGSWAKERCGDFCDSCFAPEVRSVMGLLEDVVRGGELAGEERSERGGRRLAAWQRLQSFLCGPLFEGGSIGHYCPLGCHPTRAAA
eukprot:8504234-Alexandrium_andersonii.AAC.1